MEQAKRVRVIDTMGLDDITIAKIEPVMWYTKDYMENDTRFVELINSKNQVIRIFPERIRIVANK